MVVCTKQQFGIAMSSDHLMKAKEKTSKEIAKANQQIHLKVLGMKMLVITKNPIAIKRDPILSKKQAAVGNACFRKTPEKAAAKAITIATTTTCKGTTDETSSSS